MSTKPGQSQSATACPAGGRCRRPAARTFPCSPARASRPPAGCRSPLRRLRRRSLRDRSRQARLGQHLPGQHQDRARRDLPPCQPQARPTLPFQLRLALQPVLSPRQHGRAPRLRRHSYRAAPLPSHHCGCVKRIFRYRYHLRALSDWGRCGQAAPARSSFPDVSFPRVLASLRGRRMAAA